MIENSREIVQRAISEHNPYAKVGLFSGGNDSLLLLEVLKELNIELDYIIHVHTGTGLPQTLEFVRNHCTTNYDNKYLEASAGNAYENYVLRKGFFGKGVDAHAYAYHILKAEHLRKAISKHIRKGVKGRKVLLFNGVRVEESDNRKYNFGKEEVMIEKGTQNVWVNVIHWWTGYQKNAYLNGNNIKRSPVSIELGRSGECMCGTMQGALDRAAAKKFCPSWGKWLDDLEKAVIDKGFPWKWGESINKYHHMEMNGQINMFQPMCVGCKALG